MKIAKFLEEEGLIKELPDDKIKNLRSQLS